MSDAQRLDSLGVHEQVATRGDQMRDAASSARSLPLVSAAGVTTVHVDLPAGSSSPGGVGHAVAASGATNASVPIIAVSDGPRSWLGPGSLVLTVDPLTVERAGASGASIVDLAQVAGVDSFHGGLAAVLVVLDRLALIGEVDADLAAAAGVLDGLVAGRGEAANELARRIGRTMPIVYGVGALGAVAAARWKAAVNRFAKAPGFAGAIPGIDVDEVCGWAQHGDVTRQIMTLVTLRHGSEHPDGARRLESTLETCEEIMAGVHEIAASPGGELAQLAELVAFGELVALGMAASAGIDPGPLPVLDRY